MVDTKANTVSPIPSSALAIYAHPDDAEVSCGGTLAFWSRNGCQVDVVIGTTGDKGSSDEFVSTNELVCLREQEIAQSAKLTGISAYHMLKYPDGAINNDEVLREKLVALMRKLKPEVVLCPDPTSVFFGQHYYNHRDHREVGWAVLDSISPAVSSPLYFPNTGKAHKVEKVLLSGTSYPDKWVDISTALEVKISALLCHKTQLRQDPQMLAEVIRQRAEEEGRRLGLSYAESFRQLIL